MSKKASSRVVPVETRVEHAFELSEPTEDLAGVSFTLEKVPKVIVMMMTMMMLIMGW